MFGILLLALFVHAFERRATLLPKGPRPLPLKTDAAEFYQRALVTPFPCFTTGREPVILCIARAVLPSGNYPRSDPDAVVADHTALRWTGVALNLLGMGLLALTALVCFGRAAALVAAFLWADNFWSVYYAIGFLREDLVAGLNLALLVLFVAWLRGGEGRLRRIGIPAGLAATGALLALTRLEMLGLIPLMSLAFAGAKFWKGDGTKRDLWTLLSVNAAIVLLCAPYLLFNYRHARSLTPPLDRHARFWRNHEFAGRPGYPSRAEVIENPYRGEAITPLRYVFGLHSPGEACGRYLAGYAAAFTTYLPHLYFDRPLFVWLVPAGMLACLICKKRRREGAFLVLMSLVSIGSFAFILPLDVVLTPEVPEVGTGVETRFAYPLLAYSFLFCAALTKALQERLKSLPLVSRRTSRR